MTGTLLLLAMPGAARAHAILQSSTPAASTTVEESPSRIELRFSETVEQSLASIRLFDASRREVPIGDAVRKVDEPSVMGAGDIPALADGVYVVVWRVTSADGHPVSGAFAFQVGAGSAAIGAGAVDAVLGGLSTRSDLGIPLGVAKFLAYLGALVLLGAVVFCWRTPLTSHVRVVATQATALAALAVGSLAVLVLQGAYASGRSWSAVVDSSLVGDVLSTRLGAALLIRLVLCLAWAALVVRARRGWPVPTWWFVAAGLVSVGTVTTFSVSGHASGLARAPLYIAVDAVHLAAVGAWAGALVVFAVLVRPGGPDAGAEAQRFSTLATWTMPTAMVTGVIAGLKMVGGVGSVAGTAYGRILIAKVCVVAVVAVLGARARRRLVGDGGSRDVIARDVRRTVRLESALVAVVLAITALLVGTSPNPTTAVDVPFSARLAQADVFLDLQVVPARVGTSEVHALFTPPGGTLAPVEQVTVTLSLPSGNVPAIPVRMIELGPNHWSGVVRIPYAGTWRLEVRASPKQNSRILFATTVDIGQ